MKAQNKCSKLKVRTNRARHRCFRKIKKGTALKRTNKLRHNNSEATGLLYSTFTILTRLLCPVWDSKLQTDMKPWRLFTREPQRKLKD